MNISLSFKRYVPAIFTHNLYSLVINISLFISRNEGRGINYSPCNQRNSVMHFKEHKSRLTLAIAIPIFTTCLLQTTTYQIIPSIFSTVCTVVLATFLRTKKFLKWNRTPWLQSSLSLKKGEQDILGADQYKMTQK